jgi:hypothetical protein
VSCGATRRQLSAYLEGDLGERDEARLRGHLDSCAECSAELRALQRAVRLLRELGGAEPPGDLADRIVERVRAEEARPSRWRRAPLIGGPGLSWVAPLAMAAGLGAIAWLGGVDGGGPPAAVRDALLPPVVAAFPRPALRDERTRPSLVAGAPAPAPSLPPIASCLEGRAPADACAPWHSWFVAMALEDSRRFVQELDRLPASARGPWLRGVSEFARRSGSAPLVSHELRSSRDPRATRIAARFDRGAFAQSATWKGR